MASATKMLSMFFIIMAVRSQAMLSGTCASDNSTSAHFAFFAIGDQCPVPSQSSENVTKVQEPQTISAPSLKIQIKKTKVEVEATNSTIAVASAKKSHMFANWQSHIKVGTTKQTSPASTRQIKVRTAKHTFQDDHPKLRKIKVHAFQAGHNQPRQIKVANVSEKGDTKTRRIKVRTVGTPSKDQEKKPQTPKAPSLLKSSTQVTVEEVSDNLIAELKGTFRPGADHSRVNKWEKVIQPLYSSLPKNAWGNLEHAGARYVLHRALVRQHGWSMKGLEPQNTSTPSDSFKEWVPEYLLNAIEQLLGTKGIDSQELAVLAATFEDLVHKEAIARLREVYELKGLPIENSITKRVAEEVVATYMTVYTADFGPIQKTTKDVVEWGLSLEEHTKRWLREVQGNVTGAQLRLSGNSGTKGLDFKTTAHIVEAVGERYGDFNDFECRALKNVLLEKEDSSKPGMLKLSDFYRTGMNQSYWNFNEKIDYLRVLGALDESGSEPRVIIPNYVTSEANCLPVSSFYSVCCRSECENLMEDLERDLPTAVDEPEQVAKTIAAQMGFVGPQQLSRTLLNLLQGIAVSNGGMIPLHSREFAQFMHHAFPRECPVPHDSFKHPQTPDEWLKENGALSAKASKEEMAQHVDSWRVGGSSTQPAFTFNPSTLTRPRLLVKQGVVSDAASNAASTAASILEDAPCVESAEDLEETMPWHPQECEEEVFQQPKAETDLPVKLKVQPFIENTMAEQEAPAIMFGPEQQPMKHSFRALLASSPDVKPKDTADADVLWEVYNEPAQSYWEHEDRASQELDKTELPEIPTLPPQPTAGFDQSSSLSINQAMESAVSQNAALVFLAVFLTLMVGIQAATKARDDKTGNPYSKIEEARQAELVRAAAIGSFWQQWSNGVRSHDIV